jgi:hypothetical protein
MAYLQCLEYEGIDQYDGDMETRRRILRFIGEDDQIVHHIFDHLYETYDDRTLQVVRSFSNGKTCRICSLRITKCIGGKNLHSTRSLQMSMGTATHKVDLPCLKLNWREFLTPFYAIQTVSHRFQPENPHVTNTYAQRS